MVICFNATPEAKRALDSLLATGQFRDLSEAVSLALTNYEVLQASVGEAGQIEPRPTGRQQAVLTTAADEQSASVKNPLFEQTGSKIPELFSRKITTKPENISLAAVTPEKATATLPPSEWLFGQYNKFLPVKAVCRALLNLQAGNPYGIEIEEAISRISEAACGLGDYLSTLDKGIGLRREEARAAAFPSSDETGSRMRFGNQFVGTLKQGGLAGFPAALKLAGIVKLDTQKEARVALTAPGVEFAILANPMLDYSANSGSMKFSEAESSFLLAHIKNSVPREVSAYVSILKAIEEGADTPSEMDEYLRRTFKLANEVDMTSTFLTTQRTGAISRMVDLALLKRSKTGLKVRYCATGLGIRMSKSN